jgi:peptidoglycan-associated lipoprotein
MSDLALEDQVNHSKRKWILTVAALAAILVVASCKKKEVPAAPPEAAAPPPPQPTATLSVSPDSIERGGTATLSWSTENATNINIDGIGSVGPTGSHAVAPETSTTYHLTAQGAGGTAEASARLTVSEAAPAPAPQAKAAPGDAELFAQNVKDIYFDYDRYDLRPGDKAIIDADAAFLVAHPSINFTIEGHCDERGSIDYNLALGDNRANAARAALIRDGVAATRIKTISYGKEKPFCTEHNEECWQQNRRDHFVFGY